MTEFKNIYEPILGSFIKIYTEDELHSFGFLVSITSNTFLLKNKNKFWKHTFNPDLYIYYYQIPESNKKKQLKEIAKQLNINTNSNSNQTFNELYTETETILNNYNSK